MTTETEKSPREIAEGIVYEHLDEMMSPHEYPQTQKSLIDAIDKALRDRDERAAQIAKRPYSDEVSALGTDEPSVEGEKIASAIQRWLTV